ncbi:MAG: serine hydrolase domain-containing protein [Acidimicrobiales bacterium]
MDPLEKIATVGPDALAFPWASVTKPVTGLAVLVAVEEGSLSLDLPAGPPGSTIRHLLAHASGIGSDREAPLTRPGARRIYSNIGYELVGQVLSERTGMPFRDYVREAVLEPLGMFGTRFSPEQVGAGGERGSSGAASGLRGPLKDLLALAAEWSAPTLISAGTHATASSVSFPGLPGVLPGFGRFDRCDWGLGVEIRGDKHPHWTGTSNSTSTFGHFGRSGSFLWIDPEARVACAGLADRAFGPWSVEAWPALSDAVLAEFGGGQPGGPRSR